MSDSPWCPRSNWLIPTNESLGNLWARVCASLVALNRATCVSYVNIHSKSSVFSREQITLKPFIPPGCAPQK